MLCRGFSQRISLYADDVILFLQPRSEEVTLEMELLLVFGEALWLVTNIQKCSLTPIQCDKQDVSVVQEVMPCNVVDFPCKYLGLQLSVKKLTKNQWFALIERIADQLPGRKAALIHPTGRAVLIKAVLTAIPIYQLIALVCQMGH